MNEKQLTEKRAEALEQMEAITNAAKAEERAFTQDEDKNFNSLKEQIETIDKTLEAFEAQRALTAKTPQPAKKEESTEQVELRAFANIIRNRADSNITMSDNGAVVPKTIANRIIDKVKELSPLFRDAERFSVKGTLSIPYVDAANDKVTVAYASEFTDLESTSMKLLTIDLTDYLAGVLCKVSKTLLNQTDIDLTNFVINKMATAMADFCDKEIIIGTDGKATGLSTAENTVTAAAAAAITLKELIALKNTVPSKYQQGAYWVMNPATLTAIQQTLSGTSNFIVNNAIENGFTSQLLGKPVYTSENVAVAAAGAKSVYYLNPAQALAVKVNEDSVQVLNERYAAQHAIGIVEWIDFDAKIQNQQAVAVLVQKSGS